MGEGVGMSELSWRIWAIRLVVSLVLTAGVAWTVSFLVADYVVRANTSSTDTTLSGLNGSLNRLSSALEANTNRLGQSLDGTTKSVNRLQDQLSKLMVENAEQTSQLASLQTKVSKVADAVQDAGINIRASAIPGQIPNIASWNEMKGIYGLEDDSPLFLQLKK